MTFEWVRDHLIAAGKQPGNPATLEDCQAFQTAYNCTLPQAVRAAYAVMNGSNYSTDEQASWIRFWPLQEWKRVKEAFPNDPVAQSAPEETFVIADYAIECVFYVLCLQQASPMYGSVLALGATQISTVSASFPEFLSMVKVNSDSLHNYC